MTEEKKTEETAIVDESTAVATTASTTVAVSEEISFEDELLGDAGSGSEDMGLEHLTIPFYSALQPLSPQAQVGHAEHVEGAAPGMIMNTLTKQVFKANVGAKGENGILVAAVKFEPKAIEWKPRGQSGGGGLVRVWGDDDSYKNSPDYEFSKEKNRWISSEGNEVTDHYDTFIVQLGYFDAEDNFVPQVGQGILSCKGSQIKKAKGWNTERTMRRITVKGKSINPPGWYQTYRIQTKFEQNDKGSWFGWVISAHKPILDLADGKALYTLCKEMYESLRAGDLKADESGRMAEAGSGEGGLASGADIPF